MKVIDVKRLRVRLLGWEVDSTGELHVPKDKFTDNLNVIHRACAALAQAPDVIDGVSRYAGGTPISILDETDISRLIESTYRVFDAGNPREAARYLREANKLLATTPSSDALGRAREWRCVVAPSVRNRRGEGQGPRGGVARSRREAVRSVPNGKLFNARTTTTRQEESFVDELLAELLLDDDSSLLEANWDSILYGDRVSGVERNVSGVEPFAERPTGRGNDEKEVVPCSPHSPHLDPDCVNETFRLSPPAGPRRSRVDGDPASSEPSAAPVFGNVFVGWRWLRRERTTVFAATHDEGEDEARLWVVRDVRPEVALIRWMRTESARLARHGLFEQTFTMSDVWLAKHLLQRGRSFHAPILFGEVLAMHDAVERTGVRLVIHGGGNVPSALGTALEQVPLATSSVGVR